MNKVFAPNDEVSSERLMVTWCSRYLVLVLSPLIADEFCRIPVGFLTRLSWYLGVSCIVCGEGWWKGMRSLKISGLCRRHILWLAFFCAIVV